MTPENFLEKFDQLADAPGAPLKLRRLVLDLAVQGTLVGRRASEGSGHTLLEDLRKLPPEGNSKSRTPKNLPAEPAIKLVIPTHWALTTVVDTTRETGFFCDGDWVESKDQDPDGTVRLIQLADVGDGQYRDRSSRFMSKKAADRLNCSFLEAGDILVARMPDPLGRCCRFPGDPKPAVTVVDVCILRPNVAFFDPDFLVVAINSPSFRRLVASQATGTTRSRISRSKLAVLPIPLPPLGEQKRIVAKVDDLMALCDRLEAQQQEREAQQAALARASLRRFVDAPITANLDFLSHRSYVISPIDLRQAILTLAIRGRLVPQNPCDDSAEQLLREIACEKAAAAKGHRSGVAKPLAPVGREELPYELPPGWAVARLIDVVVDIQTGPFGSSLHKSDYRLGGTPVVNPASLKEGKIVPIDEMAIGDDTLSRLEGFQLAAGDIVLARRGEMGRCAVVTEREAGWLCGTGSLVLRMPRIFHAPYLAMLIGAPQARDYLGGASVGTTMQNLNQSILAKMPVGIPPDKEQQRIVAKVDQLMAMLDQLESQLMACRGTGAKLLDAVVAELAA